MQRCWIIGLFALVAALVLLTPRCTRKSEPVYAGKTVTEWLNAGQEDVCQAVHEIGLPALPYILDKLAREDPRFGANSSYFRVWRRMPATVRRVLPRPGATNFDEDHACSAILELGPSVIPALSRSLKSPNRAVSEVSVHVLGLLGQRGKNISVAFPRLKAASCGDCPEVASRARWALKFSTRPPHE